MLRVLAPALAAVAVLLVACAGSTSDSPPPAPTVTSPAAPASCAPARAAQPGDYAETLTLDLERQYFVRVPSGYTGSSPAPVMLAFPASGMPATVFAGMSGLPALADRRGVLLVVLESAGDPATWNPTTSPGAPDDLRYATAVLDAVSASYCVDEARVFAAAYSDGGGMAQTVTCASPGRIAALALVASTYGACRAETPLVAFHGLADPIVPYEGGATASNPSREFPSVRRSVTEWARVLGCDALAVVSRPTTEVELSTFKRCKRGDGVVLLYAVIGGGHTWPGSPPLDAAFGFSTQQLSAADAMWSFFEAFPREE